MGHQIENVLRWLRVCPKCSAMVGPVDGFCSSCLGQVVNNISEPHFTFGFPFPIWSLLRWSSEAEEVGQLVKALKGQQNQRAYRILAHEMLKCFRSHRVLRQKPALFVFPPSKGGVADHAQLLALSLSYWSGIPHINAFASAREQKEQKSLDKSGRQGLRFERSHVRLPPSAQNEGIIFVDDLLTTGSTARAAWLALNKPKRFTVWTLACRPLEKLI